MAVSKVYNNLNEVYSSIHDTVSAAMRQLPRYSGCPDNIREDDDVMAQAALRVRSFYHDLRVFLHLNASLDVKPDLSSDRSVCSFDFCQALPLPLPSCI